jgi:hypothetical protein
MPTVKPGNSNPLDSNASNPNRMRRNFQRLKRGGVTPLITLQPDSGLEITADGLAIEVADTSLVKSAAGVGVNLETASGLTINNGVGVLLADHSLQTSTAGLSVQEAPAGSIQTTTMGIGLRVADASLTSTTMGLAVQNKPNGGIQTSTTGIGVLLADTSLQTSTAGLSVSLSATGALATSGGLGVKVDGTTIKITGDVLVATASGSGTVTDVGLAVPTSVLSITGSPITTSGTMTIGLQNQNINTVFAGPATGSAGTPAFRALVAADIPALSYVSSVAIAVPSIFSISGSPVTSTGTMTIGLQNASANTVLAGPTSGVATTPTFRALTATDIPALSYVTSVALSMPAEFSVANSPVTSTGTLTVTKATQTANTIYAGPSSGSAAAPTFRAITGADIASATLPVVTADPSSPSAGMAWYNSTTLTPTLCAANDGTNIADGPIPLTVLYSAQQNQVTGNTSPQTLPNSSFTFPSGYLNKANRTLEFYGVFATGTSGASASFTINFTLGGQTFQLYASPVLASAGGDTLIVQGIIGIRTTGSSGTLYYGVTVIGSNTSTGGFTNFSAASGSSLNWTGTVAFSLTASSSVTNTSNVVQTRVFSLKVIS